MITNPDELQYVRQQLVHIESALTVLRRDILPVNPKRYELMAEGYVDQILKLRGEIDDYLGIRDAFAGANVEREPAVR